MGGDELDFDQVLRNRVGRRGALLSDNLPVLADLTARRTTVDGLVFSQMVVAGFAKLALQKKELNHINVFPIADGDTGTNMCICLKVPARNLLTEPECHLLKATMKLAADVLLNGQGNSGTILSHFFITLGNELKQGGAGAEASVGAFAAALGRTGVLMAKAVSNAVDGTLVSTARDCCQGLEGATTLKQLIKLWDSQAMEEVSKTPSQLCVDGRYVLREAGVVDSGALGFAYLVRGMALASDGDAELVQAMTSKAILLNAELGAEESDLAGVDHSVTDSKFQYCTECVVHLVAGTTKHNVLDAVGSLGDSIASVSAPVSEQKGGGELLKIHIHSNKPDNVFDTVAKFSRTTLLLKEKVEDMFAEREEAHGVTSLQSEGSGQCFGVLTDFIMVHPSDAKQASLLPTYVVLGSVGDPYTVGGGEMAPLVLFNKLRAKPERVYTAAPTPINAQLAIEGGLRRAPELVVIVPGSWASATHRNVVKAIAALPTEQRKKPVVAPLPPRGSLC